MHLGSERRQALLALLVEEDVEASIGGIAHGSGAEAGDEAAQALGGEDGA